MLNRNKSKVVYLLQNKGSSLGAYTSYKQLAKGVSYWMQVFPEEILSFEKWKLNYIPEPNSWGWAYVPFKTSVRRLICGGASFIPMKKFYGHNLIGLDLRKVNTHYEVK